MPVNDRAFEVRPILTQLRLRCGDSEFGYRMQGFFAHVLLQRGAHILEINAQGHPDIKARLGSRDVLVQVKSLAHVRSSSQLLVVAEDLAGIACPEEDRGYLAVLDCAVPVSWFVIPEPNARLLVGRPANLATLQADRAEPLSSECSEIFLDLILGLQDRLERLPYALLRERALRGAQLE